jgi:hypothetical protein
LAGVALRGDVPRGVRFLGGDVSSPSGALRAIPSFSINVCASNGARNFTSVLSKKQNTSRGDFVGGFFDEIFSASAGSDPVCHALMRLAHRSSDLSEYPLL